MEDQKKLTNDEVFYHQEAVIMEKRGRRLRRAALAAGVFQAISLVCLLYTSTTTRWVLIDWSEPNVSAYQISSNIGLFKLGVVADAIMVIAETFVGVLLGLILIGSGVNPATSTLIAAFKVVATIIMGVNVIFMIAAGLLLDENLPIYTTIEQYFYSDNAPPIGTQLVYFMLLTDKYGMSFAQVFNGIHLLIFGFAIVMWGVLPRWLGYTTFFAGPALFVNSFCLFMIPGYNEAFTFFFLAPYIVSSIWLTAWLLVNTPHPSKNREFTLVNWASSQSSDPSIERPTSSTSN